MSNSMIATIYLIALVVFFLLLVVLTITLIAGKSRQDEEDETDETDETNETDGEEDIFAKADAELVSHEVSADGQDSASGGSMEYMSGADISDETYVNTYDEETREEYEDDTETGFDSDSDSDTAPDTASDTDFDSGSDTADMTEELKAKEFETEETEKLQSPVTDAEVPPVAEPENKAVTENQTESQTETKTEAEVKTEETETVTGTDSDAEEASPELEAAPLVDSAFAPEPTGIMLTNEELDESVREAVALGEAVASGFGMGFSAADMFNVQEELDRGRRKARGRSSVPSTDDFFWYNRLDVAEKPAHKTPEMYYHYFDTAKDCIEDLLIEMYDCALVRTEEIRYIAYGIEPRAISVQEILSSDNYVQQNKMKEPTTQDLVRIYEKWCSYVDKLFDKVEIHADAYTIDEIRNLLCEFGRNDVDVLLEGK